jgi:hypothetical protein
MAERSGFSPATIDRARAVLERGGEAQVALVADGTGLKQVYNRILRREREERERLEPPAPTVPIPGDEPQLDEEPEADDPEPVDIPELANLREALATVDEAQDAAKDLFLLDARHVFGATYEHRKALIRDAGNAGRRLFTAWKRFEKAIRERT